MVLGGNGLWLKSLSFERRQGCREGVAAALREAHP